MILNPPADRVSELQNEIRAFKQYIEGVFEDYNNINEDTRMQLELISETLAELQADDRTLTKPLPPIGFDASIDRQKKEC